MMPSSNQIFEYDVAISFAGEDRQIAEQLVRAMLAKDIKVFYDRDQTANLWGKDLIEILTDIYANKARYCLMLISKHYPEKPWTRVERRSALDRARRQPEEYILPIRIDDTPVPGIPSSVSYLHIQQYSVEEIVLFIAKKLGLSTSEGDQGTLPSTNGNKQKYQIPMPHVPKTFTQLDKDRFVEMAFDVMKDYFRQALAEIKSQDPNYETDLKEINTIKFVARIYVLGQLKCNCKIWLGSSFGPQSIQYVEGPHIDIANDNSMNDYLSPDQTTSGLGLRVSGLGLGLGGVRPDQEVISAEQAAEYYWRRFTSGLMHY